MNIALKVMDRTANGSLGRLSHRLDRTRQSALQPLITTWDLTYNEVVKHRATGDARVRCEAGTVWLTLTGDPQDYILRSGQELRLRRGDELVAQALSEATLTCATS